MFYFTLSFLIGNLLIQSQAHLPGVGLFLFFSALNFIAIILFPTYKRFFLLSFSLVAGMAWTIIYAHYLLSWSLPAELEGKNIMAQGIIKSIPSEENNKIHFLFQLKKIQDLSGRTLTIPSSPIIQINYYLPRHQSALLPPLQITQLKVGDHFQFYLRLKRIHATQNPGTFDYEALALQQHIRATGIIQPSAYNQFIRHHWYHFPINQIRQTIFLNMSQLLAQKKPSPWLYALTLGERQQIPAHDWKILRHTGTNHLMAIAGLHIGIISGLMAFCVTTIWRRIPKLILSIPAQQAGSVAALVTAFIYSGLAGFSLPTQRACMMLTILIMAHLRRIKIPLFHAWSLALLITLLTNPLNVLSESFWLSFVTIALIIYGMGGRLSPQGWWWHWVRVQWVIGAGLIPLSLLFFHDASFISFLANAMAIPWLSVTILPFCFLGCLFLFLFPLLSQYCFLIANQCLSLLWMMLNFFASLPAAIWQQAIPHYFIFICLMIGFLLLLSPSFFPGRWLGVIWLLPIFYFPSANLRPGEIRLTLLDVGQGLSVVLRTANHVLVYDAGAKYSLSADMGERILVPFLQQQNIRQIDLLVVSHGDNDHAGGVESLVSSIPVKILQTSVPEKFQFLLNKKFLSHVVLCESQLAWNWDKVNFTFIYPDRTHLGLGNDSSCVLRVSNGKYTILLAGDIEKLAERELMKQPALLSADILIAPHHGSKTSGLADFMRAIHPQHVLYGVGYRNRYHFPHRHIVEQYDRLQAKQWDTVTAGSIEFYLAADKPLALPYLYRQQNHHYWFSD